MYNLLLMLFVVILVAGCSSNNTQIQTGEEKGKSCENLLKDIHSDIELLDSDIKCTGTGKSGTMISQQLTYPKNKYDTLADKYEALLKSKGWQSMKRTDIASDAGFKEIKIQGQKGDTYIVLEFADFGTSTFGSKTGGKPVGWNYK